LRAQPQREHYQGSRRQLDAEMSAANRTQVVYRTRALLTPDGAPDNRRAQAGLPHLKPPLASSTF
jgi:hypothetical protein